jgi:predicted glutamine amidotransferase
MIHNGTGRNVHGFINSHERLLLESTNDSARAFEYLRKEIISYYCSDPKKSLNEAVRNAYSLLLQSDPDGLYNIILTNGYLSWCFIHWRPFYLLSREKDPGNVSIISTIKLNENEEWTEINKISSKKAKMLVFSGHSILMNGDIPK